MHLLCCGVPLLMNILGGSVGFWLIFQPFTPLITLIQGGILGWSFHKIYGKNHVSIKSDKIIFWVILCFTLITITLSHSDLLKSEEEILKERQIKLFFKKHQSK
jgi:hypothetical protein